jgi:hypothetical protein
MHKEKKKGTYVISSSVCESTKPIDSPIMPDLDAASVETWKMRIASRTCSSCTSSRSRIFASDSDIRTIASSCRTVIGIAGGAAAQHKVSSVDTTQDHPRSWREQVCCALAEIRQSFALSIVAATHGHPGRCPRAQLRLVSAEFVHNGPSTLRLHLLTAPAPFEKGHLNTSALQTETVVLQGPGRTGEHLVRQYVM